MRKIIVLSLMTLFVVSCATQKIVKKEVTTSYTNVVFTPQETTKELDKSFTLSIEPIDAKELNKEVFETLIRDGSYEKRIATSFDFYEKNENLSRSQRKLLEKTKQLFEYINNLATKGEINQYVQSNFLEKVYYSYLQEETYGYDGSEIMSMSDNSHHSHLNPYKINDRYLSLFRFTFNNNGKEINSVDINSFQISDNVELLYPFKNEYFEKAWENDAEKMKYIYRMNMPEKLTVTPSQSVVKYISTPAINPESKNITVSYIKDKIVVNYPFELNFKTIEGKEVFSLYTFIVNTVSDKIYTNPDIAYFVVDFGKNHIIPLKSNSVYILDKNANDPITLHTLIIPSKNTKFKHIVTQITPSDLAKKRNTIVIK